VYVDKFDKHDKLIPVGYNVRFDLDFLRQWFLAVDPDQGRFFGSYFWNSAIDIYSLLPFLLSEDTMKALPNFKLLTVANAYGIIADPAAAHNALYDALLVEQILTKFLSEGETHDR